MIQQVFVLANGFFEYQPISGQGSLLIPPENIRKRLVL